MQPTNANIKPVSKSAIELLLFMVTNATGYGLFGNLWSRLVPKVANAGEDHGHAPLVRGSDDFFVSN